MDGGGSGWLYMCVSCVVVLNSYYHSDHRLETLYI